MKLALTKLKHIFNTLWHLTPEEEELFRQRTLERNHAALLIVSAIIFVAELYNIFRVLFLSNSGLGTLNNIVYFILYLTLLFTVVTFVLVGNALKGDPTKLSRLHMVTVVMWLVWNALLNYQDLTRDVNVGTGIFVAAVFAFAVCIIVKPAIGASIILGIYGLFLLLAADFLSTGALINLTITMVVALAISLRTFYYTINDAILKKEIAVNQQNLLHNQEKLQANLEKYEILVNNANDIVVEWDVAHCEIHFSAEAEERYAVPTTVLSAEDWITDNEYIHYGDKAGLIYAIQHAMGNGEMVEYSMRILVAPGAYAWFKFRMVFQTNENHEIYYAVGLLNDIDKQQRFVDTMSVKAKRDPLTNLLNAVAFQECVSRALLELKMGQNLVLMLLDLDDFKSINDTYSHLDGDRVLRALAETLQELFPDGHMIGRLWGDTFAMAMPNVTGVYAVEQKAQEVLCAVSALEVGTEKIKVGCSLGISSTDKSNVFYDMLLANADRTIYRAKAQGKGCYVLDNSFGLMKKQDTAETSLEGNLYV